MKNNQYPETTRQLGITYSPQQTTFRVWSPLERQVDLALYQDAREIFRTLYPMTYIPEEGVHELTLSGDFHGTFYTYIIDKTTEVTDPYAISANTNGTRSAVIDLNQTHPEGWEDDHRLEGTHPCDAILYELHLKDFTGLDNSNAVMKGKYLGLSESGTLYHGLKTGLDHIEELGVTHVHLMPVYDFITVDESQNAAPEYNWGYDPEHYNCPEGSYSTDADDPVARVKELKTLVKALHDKGLKVVLDVVYNHMYRGGDTNFNVLAPNYYFRMTEDGHYSNGSGCGNEFCSEHPMARKFIIESLVYWMEEYHIDGFRFDLMSLIDLTTIKAIRKALPEEVLIYGEPWMGGLSTLDHNNTLHKGGQCGQHFALFNDDFRNAIKGDNDGNSKGFIQGNLDERHQVKTGIMGSIPFDSSHIGFASQPEETINYFNAHDNLIIYDKIVKSMPHASEDTLKKVNKMAFNILLLSQGIPFFHAGNEFMRDKKGEHNSYNASLDINGIDWSLKEKHLDFFNYVKDLIEIRKRYPLFRLHDAQDIKDKAYFIEDTEHLGHTENAIAYSLHNTDPAFEYDCLLVVHNAQNKELLLSLSELSLQLCHQYKVEQSKIKEVNPHLSDLKKASLSSPSDLIPSPEKAFDIYQILSEKGLSIQPQKISPENYHLIKIPAFTSAVFEIRRKK